MAQFIMALNINPHAKKEHPDLAHYVNDSLKVLADHKLKVVNVFATLGRFDYIAHIDADDQATVFKAAAKINSMGVLETETWPVIPYDDFSQIIG
jgi:uncharacterized protein with GYD domain